jgi:hypothetical protein
VYGLPVALLVLGGLVAVRLGRSRSSHRRSADGPN